jgi:hypothetical protein
MAMTRPTIAILGWGSLIWDIRHRGAPEFDKWHGPWLEGGPSLKLELSRVSQRSRPGVLTLVIDPVHGATCRTWYCLSKRIEPNDAFEDLSIREGISEQRHGRVPASIGRFFRGKSGPTVCRDPESGRSIQTWADSKGIDVVTWTDLRSNFEHVTGRPFSISAALAHLDSLAPELRSETMEYARRAPPSVQTELRRALEKRGAGE